MSILFKWLSRALITFFLLTSVVAIISYNLASRSLPEYNKSLFSDKIENNVEKIRDSSNVAHIFTLEDNDALIAHGYAHAQDRFWQLNILRLSLIHI